MSINRFQQRAASWDRLKSPSTDGILKTDEKQAVAQRLARCLDSVDDVLLPEFLDESMRWSGFVNRSIGYRCALTHLASHDVLCVQHTKKGAQLSNGMRHTHCASLTEVNSGTLEIATRLPFLESTDLPIDSSVVRKGERHLIIANPGEVIVAGGVDGDVYSTAVLTREIFHQDRTRGFEDMPVPELKRFLEEMRFFTEQPSF